MEENLDECEVQEGEIEKTIFRVPQLMLDSNPRFYIPIFVSIGFFHWCELKLLNMVKHKLAAYKRMCCRLRCHELGRDIVTGVESVNNITYSILTEMERNLWYRRIETYEGDVERIICNEIPWNLINNCYRCRTCVGIPWDTECHTFSREGKFRMAFFYLLIDACFIFEFVFNYLRHTEGKKNYREEWVVGGDNDSIFDSWIQNPTWQGIVFDLLLLENQLPLSFFTFLGRLLASRGFEEMIIQMLWEFASLNHYGIFAWSSPGSCPPKKPSHLLDLFYKRIVGSDLESYEKEGYPCEELQSVNSVSSCFKHLVSYCIDIIHKDVFIHFFSRLSTRLRGFFQCSKPMDEEGYASPPALHIPPAADLRRVGVKFEAVRWKRGMKSAPLRYIRFDERKSTLYLPEVRVDLNAQSLLRNFMALEVTSANYHPRPVTNFALFMDELVNSEDDVGVLRKAGILRYSAWSDVDLAHNFKA